MHSNRTIALQLTAIAVGMLMLAYASVPLYRLFCQVTGFGGTSQRAVANSTRMVDRTVTVTFDANVDPQLPWAFEPLEKSVKVKLGENRLVAFRATNQANVPTKATATYNVTPFALGRYFNKIQRFFTADVAGLRLGGNRRVVTTLCKKFIGDGDGFVVVHGTCCSKHHALGLIVFGGIGH